MNTGRVGRLTVQSDLVLTVGDLRATLQGDGDRLVLHTNDLPGLIRHADDATRHLPAGTAAPARRRLLAGVGDQLAAAGLSLNVENDRGVVLRIGEGQRSLFSRVLLGTGHARLGGLRVLAPVISRYVSTTPSLRQRTATAATGGVLAAFIVASVLRRRHTGQLTGGPLPGERTRS